MNVESTYIISLPPEAQELLVDNGVDLVRALQNEGLGVTRGALPTTAAPVGEGGKEVVLTLLAVGLTASLVAAGVAKVLDALGRNRKFLVAEHQLVPVLDGKGQPVKDAAGQPVLYWSEQNRLVEAAQTAQDKSKFTVEARPTLLKFSVGSGA
jgi:hypothetical protein